MDFLYTSIALGEKCISLGDDAYIHLVRSRRIKVGQEVRLRNIEEKSTLYTYKVLNIGKKDVSLEYIKDEILSITPRHFSHIIWSVIDMSIVEKTLPILNELGVGKISLYYGDFSQKCFKINTHRIQNILLNSSQQCKRSDFIEIEVLKDLSEVLVRYPKACVLDFGGENISDFINLEHGIILGNEGGFSPKERELFKDRDIYQINTNTILKSQSAAIFLASISTLGI